MLSSAAANALLKTLEEPPPGLAFVLATTEPERLPPTVLSRCQHFRFRRLAVGEIAGKLAGLCETAGIEAESDALDLVARAAEGAMRDAESLLERLWADGGPIRRDAAEAALGLPPRERLEALADALAADDLGHLLEDATALYRDGFSPRTVAEQLARTLRDAVVNDATGEDGYRSELPREALLRTLHQFDDELDRFVRQDDLYALEAALIKAANAAFDRRLRSEPADGAAATHSASPSAASPETTKATGGESTPVQPAASVPSPDVAPAAAPDVQAAEVDTAVAGAAVAGTDGTETAAGTPSGSDRQAPAVAAAADDRRPSRREEDAEPAASASGERAKLSWHQVKARAPAQLKAFLQPADDRIEQGVLVLAYGERHKFHFGQLKSRQDELMSLIEEVGGPGWGLRIEGPGETVRKKA